MKMRNDRASQGDDRTIVEAICQIMGIPLSSIEARYDEAGYLIDLALSHLGLTYLPSEIGQLTRLERLHLNRNYFNALPREIGRLTRLKLLGLSNNSLATLPPEIGQLACLERLYPRDAQRAVKL